MRAGHRVFAALVVALVPSAVEAAIFTVININDSGPGSLRQAITDANLTPTLDEIHFNISGHVPITTISPLTALPVIIHPIVIDGYTQPGASVNTNPVGQGLNTVLKIQITGLGQAGPAAHCLQINTGGSTIRGLVINRCPSGCIGFLPGPHSGNKVEGNFLGTNFNGTDRPSDQPNAENVGFLGGGQTGMTVGGTTPAARNLLGACRIGVYTEGPVSNLVIQGNLIGLKASGTAAMPECTYDGSWGIRGDTGAAGFTVGGPGPGARNVISAVSVGMRLRGRNHVVQGNLIGTDVSGSVATWLTGVGLDLDTISGDSLNFIVGGPGAGEGNIFAGAYGSGIVVSGSGHIIQGNFIGTDPTGTLDLRNDATGIHVAGASDIVIGGVGPGEANIIAFNGGSTYSGGGIAFYRFDPVIPTPTSTRVTMRGNRIYGNRPPRLVRPGGLAIDLDNHSNGVTPNDFGDGDSGTNDLQNFPTIDSAIVEPTAPGLGGTRVIGRLSSSASTTFDLDFYSDDCRFPQTISQAKTYLGSFQVTTNASGVAIFNELLPVSITASDQVTATATDPFGNTSELSPRMVLSAEPGQGDASGGQAITVRGMLFEPGATLSIGGDPAEDVNVYSSYIITANAPAHPAGSAHDIVVINPSGASGVLRNGYLARFTDVAQGHSFEPFVGRIARNGLTAGCGVGLFCADRPVTRAEMAVFLVRGKDGLCYMPPDCTNGTFDDVPCTSIYSRWIYDLVGRSVAAGCGGGNYCPNDPVTREQMAVFLLATWEGPGYQPPSCFAPTFTDVPCSSPYSRWIYEIARRGITGGCGGGYYCPVSPVTRGQMSVFLSTTFRLPL